MFYAMCGHRLRVATEYFIEHSGKILSQKCIHLDPASAVFKDIKGVEMSLDRLRAVSCCWILMADGNSCVIT